MRTGVNRPPLIRNLWAFPILTAAGALQAGALAWPGSGEPLWWLQIVSLAVAAWTFAHSHSPRQAAGRAWWFATVWLACTFWWLFISMHTYGGLPAALAVVAVVALAGFLALYYALAVGLWRRWSQPGWTAVALFAALWTLAELARGVLWTGFPWGAGGYAHVDGPLSALPRWVGVYGVGAVAALLAMLLVQLEALRSQARRNLSVVALMAALIVLSHPVQDRAQQAPGREPVSVALLQGNIPQDEKFIPGGGVQKALQWYGEQLMQPQAALVVAPETALPMLPQQLPPGYWQAVAQPYQQPQSTSAALIGMPLGNELQGYTNAVVGLKSGEMPEYRYDKHHLVPFGEFIPPLFDWFVRQMNIPLGSFNRGSVGQPSMEWMGERWAPNICYEDLFGEELAVRFKDAASAPTVLVNVSNIAWFGNTLAIDQHLHISRMRALELERPMLRATNTGATVVIDHRGAVTAALPFGVQDVLQAQVQGRDGVTPFAHWVSRWGLWPLGLSCVVVVAWCAKQRKKIRANRV
ncbi:MAG: apolipoprotein N-acyltransferase [Comamonas sp.]